MAFREAAMWEAWNVLERLHQGESQRAVSWTGGPSGKTVARYFATAKDLGWEPGDPEPATAELAGKVYRGHRPARGRGPEELKAREERPATELHREHFPLGLPHFERWVVPAGLELDTLKKSLPALGQPPRHFERTARSPYESPHLSQRGRGGYSNARRSHEPGAVHLSLRCGNYVVRFGMNLGDFEITAWRRTRR